MGLTPDICLAGFPPDWLLLPLSHEAASWFSRSALLRCVNARAASASLPDTRIIPAIGCRCRRSNECRRGSGRRKKKAPPTRREGADECCAVVLYANGG